MRWGILSTANIGQKLIAGARDAGVELVAVGSRDEARGRAFADEFGIPRVHGSYEALLADDGVDAIYNPLPNALHVPWSIRALEAGKHVLCEKPLTRDVAAVEQAFDAADRAGRLLMEAFMWRFHPQTARMLELVRSGTIGQLRHVNARFGFNLDPGSGNVRWSEELEGGGLMDVGCYCVSGMRLLAGEPLRVSAERVGTPVDGRVAAVLRFANDVTGTFDCGMDVYNRSGLEVVGDQDTLWIADPWHGQSPGIVLASGERIEVERVNPYGRELLEMEAAVREGRAPALDRAESIGQARTIDALYRSADEGRAITLTSG
jgi:D-xylose 1-dehydrogenase (NADP+, D-xylono-1,5-lactone-forming)